MMSKRGTRGVLRTRLQQLSKQQVMDLLFQLHSTGKLQLADVEKLTEDQGLLFPCSIFGEELSPLESICKYLKEQQGFTYHQIAVLIKRDDRTIWTVYQHAVKKQKKKFVLKKEDVMIPVKILQDRRLSVLEHLVRYLKDHHGLRYHQIAVLIKRDDRTIWTVYQRGLQKVKR